jgi:hypothetical protein
MLQGLSATQQCFDTSTAFGGLLPADLDGSRLPTAGSPNPVVALGSAANQLAYWKFHVDWTTPANSTFTGPTTLATAAFAEACSGGTCIPQSGTTQRLDSLADRLMYRLAYRKFADGHQSLVVNHSITAGSSTGVRWYELRLDGAFNPTLFQQGTYAPDASFRWMGSIAQDQSGNMALGFSVSSSTLHPQISFTGRLAADPAGQMTQGEGLITAGAGSQTGQSLSRWGDYSMMAVDPSDDCTFWYTTEYIPSNGAFNWRTRVATFKFPGCGTATNDFSIAANPTSLTLGPNASGTSTISTSVVSGTAQTVSLSVSGVPAGASASFSPTAVTTGGSSTLTVNAGAAAPGTYSLTVTGTAPSGTHSTTVSLTVLGAPNFTIAVSPASRTITPGSSTTYTVSTTKVNGSTQTIALSVSGLPAGVSGSFSPASVTAGGSSTLTVAAAASAAPATATFTVTGTSGSITHTATASVTVSTTAPPDFTVAVSPASGTVAAGSSTTFTVSTTKINGSTQAIALSVTGLPSGVTGAFNPASVTAGGSSTLTLTAAASAAAATATFTVHGTSGATSHTASASITVTTNGTTTLQNGVPVTNLSGATGSQKFFVLNVPANQSSLVFTISGGTGDADLYVRFNALPTTTTFNCRPFLTGNSETCSFTSPAAGPWYVMIRGFAAYSGVTLKGTYTAPTVTTLTNGVAVTNISGASGSQQFWKLNVPTGQAKVVFTITGATGDADLYVRFNALPTTSTFNCRPFTSTSNETCTFTNPAAGPWYVMIRGFTAYSGVTLKGQYP